MDNYSKAVLRKKISRLVKRGALREKKIILFGASVFSKEIKNCLLEHGLSIDGIIDNDGRKIGTECMGLTVGKPADVLVPQNSGFVILLFSGGYYREMIYQLSQMGYAANKQVFVLNFKADEKLPVMAYMLFRIIRGAAAFRKIAKQKPEDAAVFIAPYVGTGDIYLIGLFFNEYIKQHGIADYSFIVVNGACKKVAEIFNIRNITVVKPTISDDIISCRRFLHKKWSIVVLNDGWMREPVQWLRGYCGLNFEKMFRYFVFGFDDSIPFELPDRRDYSAKIDELFRKYELIKGKTVVLSPYSNTLFELPDEFWENIARHCGALGYTVCTNCASESEKAINGTTAVFFPFGLAIEFMNTAGYFIGVRSGLCDIISSSSCKKIILYEKDGFFYKCSPYEYFSLIKMGLCNDAVELEYQSKNKDAFLNRVISEINGVRI